MSGQVLVRSVNPREIAWPVWLALGLAVVAAIIRATSAGASITGTIAGAAPFLFVAAVLYARPADVRFVYGAAAIVAYQAIPLAGQLLPNEWIARMPVLFDVRAFAITYDIALLIVGLVLLGMAVGGVRSRVGWLIVALGALVATVNIVRSVASLVELPLGDVLTLDLALSFLLGAGAALAWAYLLAASVDARRRYLAIGTALVIAATYLIDLLLLPFDRGPQTDFALLAIIFGALLALGWLTMAVAPLYGEVPGALGAAEGTTD